MSEYDVSLEEAHYYWVLSEICDLIRDYGYDKVMSDIDKHLKATDLEVTVANLV